MQDKTALNRLGDVLLWLGTTVLILCLVASGVNAYAYIVGRTVYIEHPSIFRATTAYSEVFEFTVPYSSKDPHAAAERTVALLEDERRGVLSAEKLETLKEARRRGIFPKALPSVQQDKLRFDGRIPIKIVKTQEAKRVLTTRRYEGRLYLAIGFVGLGVISWFMFASIAYIFNGRSPVAVLKGLFRRS